MLLWHGDEGLKVYEEIHNDYINRLIHSIFIPGVFYSIFRGVPILLNVQKKTTVFSIVALYCAYYSFTVDILTGLSTALVISPFAFLALEHHHTNRNHILDAVSMLTGSLLIQEVFGHWMFEHVSSRMEFEYVLNAIMFSPLFYARYTPLVVYTLQIYLCLYFF